jgi:UDP-3-O-[3-hydroxymyristoyl] glucosamine N-acyltransferase
MGRFLLGELAARLGVELVGDGALSIDGVADLAEARPGQIAPATDPARLEEACTTAASALIVSRPLEHARAAQLVCADPRRALGLLLELFAEPPGLDDQERGVDPRAAVHAAAGVAPTAWVGPFTYVGPGAQVGEGSRVEPFTYVGRGARVGRRCTLGPGATLAAGCTLADDATLAPGAVVGGDGFGFWRDGAGWHRVPSAAAVSVGAGSTVGANSCVDRGTLCDTRVGRGVQIDNLVQVGHNVRVEDGALLCAQVGLAGGAIVEADAVLAGQVGVADHRRVGRGARVGAQSGIVQEVPPGAEVSGTPALPHRLWLRSSVLFSRLADLARQVRALGREVSRLAARDGAAQEDNRR